MSTAVVGRKPRAGRLERLSPACARLVAARLLALGRASASAIIRDFGLSAPAPGYAWSRYYDDAVLVDRDGRVRDSVGGIAWSDGDDQRDAYADDGYADGEADYGKPPRIAYGDPDPGRDTLRPGYGYGYSYGGVYYVGGSTTTVVVQTAPMVTTTVTEEVVTYVQQPKQLFAAPRGPPSCGRATAGAIRASCV